MRFENNVLDKNVSRAVFCANSLLQHESILDEAVYLKNDWRYDDIALGSSVSFNLMSDKKPLPIYTYKPLNPWTKAIAYYDGKAIHFNIRKLSSLTVTEITGTLLHEYSHYCGFTHGSNWKTKEKCLYSVPYFLSENVSKWT